MSQAFLNLSVPEDTHAVLKRRPTPIRWYKYWLGAGSRSANTAPDRRYRPLLLEGAGDDRVRVRLDRHNLPVRIHNHEAKVRG